MSGSVNLTAYLERVGYAGSIAPTLATLEALHALHPAAIPFENLNPLLGLPVLLDQRSLEQKLIHERRGGYCFEHNLLFMRVLRELEFTVRGYAARVLWGHPEGAERPVSHMVLGVEIGGSTYLADVGFGGLTLTAPLKLKGEVEQPTPHETFLLAGEGPDYRLLARIGEDWRQLYALDWTERTDPDYAELNQAIAVSDRFRDNLIAARTDKDRRHALANTRLTTYDLEGGKEQSRLGSVAEIKDALSGVFGIALPPAELLDPALERILLRAQAEDQAQA